MKNVNWTKEQKQAIYENNSNILVSAAAGSGKTAVLVERIIEKVIKDKVDIDKILVVTFTNAAASEMRERVLDAIYKKLDDEPENELLLKQITLLNKSSICTIDSFCLEVVRNNFFMLNNLSPNFRIADTTEIELLKQDVIEDIFEEKYENEDKDFDKLIHTYTSYRDDTPLKDLVLKIYSYIQSNPFPDKWLEEKVEMFNLKDKIDVNFSKTLWGKELVKYMNDELTNTILILESLSKKLEVEPELEECYKVIKNDIEQYSFLRENINNWDNACQINNNMTFLSWPRKKSSNPLKDEAKDLRNDIKKKIKEKLGKILVCSSKDANEDIYEMYPVIEKLKNLVFEFEKEFSKRKIERNIVDFSDVEHFALEILLKEENGKIIPTDIAKKYQKKFEEIAIDEYQDSNLVQEYILNSVSRGNNIFMVGDVKQSIYKFRQAMPELFIKKYNTYKLKENKKDEEDLKIQLFKNFRSRKNILDFTNVIFQNIMSDKLGDIDYNNDEYLNLGSDYSEIDNQNMKTEIHIIDLKETSEDKTEKINNENSENDDKKEKNKIENKNLIKDIIDDKENDESEENERIEDSELEAKFVANEIEKLVKNKFQVWDKKKNEYRDIKYKDIVILLRSTSSLAPIYEQELINREIPTFSDSSQEYLDSIEIQTIMSLLKIIDNPMQDIPLVAVLRSFIGKFDDNDLIEIRLADKNSNFYICMEKAMVSGNNKLKSKIKKFFDLLEIWRKEQEYLSLDELIWKIYSDTGFYNYVGLMPNGELRQANLKMLFQKAKNFESSNFKGLYNFINFIDKIKLSSGDMGAAKIIGENDDVVRIMSIHKSKGLEFPVVFLCSTNKQFNFNDLKEDILLHQDMGIGVKYINYDQQIQYDTLTKQALKNKIFEETISEEMRILYVALTRAKEKLFITGLNKDYDKNIFEIINRISSYKKENNKINPILIKQYKKYLDWILLVYEYEKENVSEIIDLKVHKKRDVLKDIKIKEKEEVNITKKLDDYVKNKINENKINENKITEGIIKENKKINEVEINESKMQKNIEKILEYKYPHLIDTKIVTKSSVTQLKELKENAALLKELNLDDKNVALLKDLNSVDENKNYSKGSNLTLTKKDKENKKEFPQPKFLNNFAEEEITPAKKGTLTHLCLQKLNLKTEYDINKIKDLIQEMEFKKIITEKEAKSIDINKVLNFTKSEIWNDLKSAKTVEREKSFYINIPAKKIYGKKTDENILVQGMIDLYYIDKDENIILVDYKTDYIKNGEENKLIKRYKNQLDLYAYALEESYGKKVYKKIIYSVELGKSIEITGNV